MRKIIAKGIWGGIFIAIGTLVFLSLYPSPLAPCLFSVGLLSIFLLDEKLFTGAVSFLSKKTWQNVLTILVCNLIGCAVLFMLPPSEVAQTIIANKVALHPLLVVAKGALCGVTITAALMCHLKGQTWMSIVYVMVFILAGFEHSIANACFIISSRVFTLDTLYLFLLSALGNTIGSVIFYRTGVEK